MVASMTAFARLDSAGDWGNAVWEIRTVNHRYLDVSLRLPEELRVLENTVREHIAQKLNRGKIDCTLRYDINSKDDELNVNTELANQLIQVAEQLEIQGPTSINRLEVLRWPGVLERKSLNIEKLSEPLLRLLDETLDNIVATRKREGNKIQGFIQQRCDSCTDQVKIIRSNLPTIIAAIKDRFHTRAKEANLELDNERLEQELILVCQKMDVAEELDRLDAHIEEVKRVLKQDKPIGRRLDFLMQEMNREANTLGSKSAHLDMSNTSVDLRVLIEQMREQIQNVE